MCTGRHVRNKTETNTSLHQRASRELVAALVKNSLPFNGPEISLTCSQEPATLLTTEPNKSRLHPHTPRFFRLILML